MNKIGLQQAAREFHEHFSRTKPIQFTIGWHFANVKVIRVFATSGTRVRGVPKTFRGYNVRIECAPPIEAHA